MKLDGDYMIINHVDKGVSVSVRGDLASQLTMLSSAAISVQGNLEMSDQDFMLLMIMTFKACKENLDKSIEIDAGKIKDIIEHESEK